MDTRHPVNELLAELDKAEQQFTATAELLGKAFDFLAQYKGFLNEHHFGAKLEASIEDRELFDRLVDNQHQLRCSYGSGRLTFFKLFSRLKHDRDKFASAAAKIMATIPLVYETETRALLSSRCLAAVQRYEELFAAALGRSEKETHHDPTAGQWAESLTRAFERFLREEVSGQESDPQNPTYFRMLLTPLSTGDGYASPGIHANDRLVEECNVIVAILQSEQYRAACTNYGKVKRNLNERQYVRRLQDARTGGGNAEALHTEQRAKRLAFLQARATTSELYRQLEAALANVAPHLSAVKAYVRMFDDTSQLVLMNNVLAASAISHSARLLLAKWRAEMTETAELAVDAERSVSAHLRTLGKQEPFASQTWIYLGSGEYGKGKQ